MKLLQTFVVAGLLTGTACQQIPPKTENVSADDWIVGERRRWC